MFTKIKTLAQYAVLATAAVQAARGWYYLGTETVTAVKEAHARRNR